MLAYLNVGCGVGHSVTTETVPKRITQRRNNETSRDTG